MSDSSKKFSVATVSAAIFLFLWFGFWNGYASARSYESRNSFLGQAIALFEKTFGGEEKVLEEVPLYASENQGNGATVFVNTFGESQKSEKRGNLPGSAAQKETVKSVTSLCSSETNQPLHLGILFSEIAWMGDVSGSDHEWIELRNITNTPFTISGWQIMDAKKQVQISIRKNTTVEPNGFYVLRRGEEYEGALGNEDEKLQLFDANCNLIDEVSANPKWPAGENDSKKTMERSSATLAWYTSSIIGGTQGKENLSQATSQSTAISQPTQPSQPVQVATTSPASQSQPTPISTTSGINPSTSSGQATTTVTTPTISKVVINRIQVAGESANDEFVEIFNTGSEAVNLSEWSIQYRGSNASSFSKKNFTSGHTVQPGGTFLISHTQYQNAASAQMTHSSFSMSGTGGTIFLVSNQTLLTNGGSSAILDKFAYGEGDYLFPESETFIPAPEASSILKRKVSSGLPMDTDNNRADFEI